MPDLTCVYFGMFLLGVGYALFVLPSTTSPNQCTRQLWAR